MDHRLRLERSFLNISATLNLGEDLPVLSSETAASKPEGSVKVGMLRIFPVFVFYQTRLTEKLVGDDDSLSKKRYLAAVL